MAHRARWLALGARHTHIVRPASVRGGVSTTTSGKRRTARETAPSIRLRAIPEVSITYSGTAADRYFGEIVFQTAALSYS
jgi:hypothetical protein